MVLDNQISGGSNSVLNILERLIFLFFCYHSGSKEDLDGPGRKQSSPSSNYFALISVNIVL